MSQSEIIVTSNPRGVFKEGIVSGTPKPGTCMTMTSAAEVNGRFTWEPYNADADGNQRLVAVLLEDSYQGKTRDNAYVSGDRCFLYCPVAGEELKMLVANISGTADDHTVGEVMMIDDGTGKLITTTGTPESEPFQLLEAATDPTADAHMLCVFTGY